ncbi:hypothetical protein J1N35_028347 [Gossypium stocksii]|uniref:Uncharacterized protein n=1 Tax=Gossypium stocksii TaxID=47602 RepID=A0A9D3UVW9_9ROSI|nr:hypothetical protein J1N35_028347 [Gossypium stocksii]
MNHALAAQGIQIPNFAYNFSITKGLNWLSDASDGSFLLPLHMTESAEGSAIDRHFSEFVSTEGLTREINEYMDVRSFIQNIRGDPSGTIVGEGSASRLTEGISEAGMKKKENENVYQSIMGALKRAHELHANLDGENKKLLE